MTEHGWNEQDRALSENLPELPPEEMVAQVTPWKRAMGRILAGMALTSVTLEVLGLQYLLPAAGMILSLLGFRTLRRENRAFAACYGITVIRTVILWATLVLNATIYPLDGQGETAQPSLTALFVGLQFASLLCFSRGLEGVKRKAGMPDAPNGARWLLLWYALVILLWLWRYSGLLLTLAMLGAYFGMIYSVFRLSGQIDAVGYAIKAAPVRLSDALLAVLLAGLLVLGIIGGYQLGGQYPMRWAPAAAEEHSPAEETSARLLELGFPADVLEDMSPEDVAACEGALRVVAERSASSDLPELRITTIAVELPGTESRWRIIHHFVWASNPDFFGTEAIRLTPAPQNDDAWTMEGEVTGRLLCDRDGATEAAPCFTLGTETVTADSIFWGEQTTTSTWATFSLPGDAQRPRGYLAYTARDASGQSSFLGSWISYTHQCSRLRYPAITAQEALQSGIGGSGGGFATVWASLQLDPRPDNAKSMD